jgi:hypothetical protein
MLPNPRWFIPAVIESKGKEYKMNNSIKAFEIWKHLDKTNQGFCFDEYGVIWDRKKCNDIIDKEFERDTKAMVKAAQDLYYEHHIK